MGRRVTDPDFRAEYENANDAVLPSGPPGMYVATTLGQTSLVVNPAVGVIQNTFDAAAHGGTWEFTARACIDLTSEIYCDPGTNSVQVVIVEAAPEPDDGSTGDDDDEKDGGETPEPGPDDGGEPGPDPQNSPPVFTEYDRLHVYEAARGSEVVVQLAPVEDADAGDQVTVSAELPDGATTWMSFDAELR